MLVGHEETTCYHGECMFASVHNGCNFPGMNQRKLSSKLGDDKGRERGKNSGKWFILSEIHQYYVRGTPIPLFLDSVDSTGVT
jgi:hypothetical protein